MFKTVPVSQLLLQNRDGMPIRSVEDWFSLAPPRGRARHWKDEYSAKELAKAWFGTDRPTLPHELAALLANHVRTAGFVPEIGIAECKTRLDSFRGESRNHDLVLVGQVNERRILVAIEAKAGEAFGGLIRDEHDGYPPPSKKQPRILHLLQALFAQPLTAALGGLRYQLLTGAAGTLIEAHKRGADLAVFVVHEFVSHRVRENALARNEADFKRFVGAFSGSGLLARASGLMTEQEIRVPGEGLVPATIPLLIGKVRTRLT